MCDNALGCQIPKVSWCQGPPARHLRLGLGCISHETSDSAFPVQSHQQPLTWNARYANSTTTTMAAVYKPAEAIALLRPTLLLPRIQPVSSRRAQLGRKALSSTCNVQATHTSTSNPPPQPKRKSISLTGDTGQVRWSDLSPVEKVVRTTQQSANLAVVVVGILATVRHSRSANSLSFPRNKYIQTNTVHRPG